MIDNENKKLALLVDADNAQASVFAKLLAEVTKFGICSVKRAYGDWTTTHLKSWKDILHKHAIQPVQQFSYTIGKNSSDSSLIIDAMDLLHEGHLDGFCLVTSDSDFTRLATRIREDGLVVYGFGEKKTPEAFIAACDKFVYTENLGVEKQTKGDEKKVSKDNELKCIISEAINAISGDDGWAPLSGIGGYITKNIPEFDSRNFGYEKLGKLVKALPYIETNNKKDSSSHVHIYVREKTV
ncbi:MAG: NYN domain-containing protein [Victivallales bacterium]|nr:NYN domain-containing protein [Victivallales bacterium]MCF7889583.1 NYN domain-containing protein [Victivallales bacterium]